VEDGDPAAIEETWLRPVTNETHLVRRQSVHHGSLKKWLGPPEDATKPWKLELSGRLLSLVETISGDAANKVESQRAKLAAAGKGIPSALQYCGILHSSVEAIRAITDFSADVIYEPNEDEAHANIVVRDKDASEILTVVDTLRRKLVFLDAEKVPQTPVFAAQA
jgi:hypothetical protein